jgi:hypothetical protein
MSQKEKKKSSKVAILKVTTYLSIEGIPFKIIVSGLEFIHTNIL